VADVAQPTDAQLVAQILAGDPSPYRLLVERHQQAVYNAAFRLLGNRDEATDIAQDTFLRAYQGLNSFDPARPLSPWLCRIAINLSLNRLKRQRSTVSLDANASGARLELPDLSADPQRQLLHTERHERLHQAILALPPEQRVVIELRHFQEQSYAEIAARLDLSLANVKSRLFRARQQLRQLLENGEDL
jgi:RNA polymerase sigma-70 factor (ECF subfamily)